jgi:glycine dehydrogenase
MIEIRAELEQVVAGQWPADDNPLANAPHTAAMVTADEWHHPYPRSLAAYPGGVSPTEKYWAPVRRINDAYGDRNLVCSCPPLEAYEG